MLFPTGQRSALHPSSHPAALLNGLVGVLILAVCAGCASVTGDPAKRTAGEMIDDQLIESAGKRQLNKADPQLKAGHIVIVSYNGVVLLTGQVESEALRTKAQRIIEGLKNVRVVHNEIQVAGPAGMIARTNDTWLTTKVKTKLIANKEVDADRVKVVTEDSVVYLLGMIPRIEAETAAQVARSVYGVQKIVKVFEYVE